jgi:hypothetical protein
LKLFKLIKARFATFYIIMGWILGLGAMLAACLVVIYLDGKGSSYTRIPANTSNAVVLEKVNGRYQFNRTGKPFVIRGAAGYQFVKELAASGGNTIICWDTARLEATLEEANRYGVAVIIGIDLPPVNQYAFYNNQSGLDSLLQAFRQIVLRYKSHPAFFAWCLGNELEFALSPSQTPFYSAYTNLLNMLHKEDTDHPVCTTVINVAKRNIYTIRWRMPGIDFIGFNTYNTIKNLRQEVARLKLFWDGPYFVSEWAPTGAWESIITSWGAPIEKSSTEKAADYRQFYNEYMPFTDPSFIGSLTFFWGSRHEYTYTWYSIFNEDGRPTEIQEAMRDSWTGGTIPHLSPEIAGMVIDDYKKAVDNVIVTPGSIHHAKIFTKDSAAIGSLHCAWQIIKEDWSSWGKTWVNFTKPMPVTAITGDSTAREIVFRSPLKEGPYRIYVTVYNAEGYCATANIPFYVVQ